MPLSEFDRAATKGKNESSHSDLSCFMPDNDFAELLWENGQIVTQGQSHRPRKSFTPTPFPSPGLIVQEREVRDAKIGLFEPLDASMVNDSSLCVTVPSANIGLHAQEEDMPPWMNYPIDDPFGSEFFSELSGIDPNSMASDRNNSFGVKDFHNVEQGYSTIGIKEGQEPSRIRPGQLFHSPQQCQPSIPSSRPRFSDFSIGGGGGSSGIKPQSQFQKLDLQSTSKPSRLAGGVTNFSLFSRPASLTNINVNHRDRLKTSSTKEASTAAASTNPMESTLVDSNRVRGASTVDLAKKEVQSAAKNHRVSLEKSEDFVMEGATSRNSHPYNGAGYYTSAPVVDLPNRSFAASLAIRRPETEKGSEAVIASSVCSGSSAGAVSNDPEHRQKRKNREGEESGYQSEDLDDDSVGVKKPTTTRAGTSTKRSRAAEVHNLSERRRRDRINEKMRALQELIPNCNKVDKASMLDEAIEYLKTLQLQVQMMSMGSGLCMSSMLIPPGLQHIRTPPMAHFPAMSIGMGMGMGMGMGYGMGMLDMNGSPGYPLIPMHTPQFPCASVAGARGLPGMPGSTGLQLFGIPGHGHGHGQGLPMSVPRAQLLSPFPDLSTKANPMMNEVSGTMVNPIPVLDASTSSRCKDQQQQQQNMKMENTQKASTSESQEEKETLILSATTTRTTV